MIDGTSVVLVKRPPPMSLAPAETASSVQAETPSASRRWMSGPTHFRAGGAHRPSTPPPHRRRSGREMRSRCPHEHRSAEPTRDLAGMVKPAFRQRFDEPVEFGTAVDDCRRGAAVLQRASRSRWQFGPEILADAARTDETQKGDAGIGRERLCELVGLGKKSMALIGAAARPREAGLRNPRRRGACPSPA